MQLYLIASVSIFGRYLSSTDEHVHIRDTFAQIVSMRGNLPSAIEQDTELRHHAFGYYYQRYDQYDTLRMNHQKVELNVFPRQAMFQ